MLNHRMLPLLLLPLLTVFSACQRHQMEPTADHHLGIVHFEPSGLEAAQEPFQKGLLLLHSFEYEDARHAFRAAQEADPAMAMAYWGEAMTHNHPLWRQQDLEAGRSALNKLAPTAAERAEKTSTELERDLLAAADILYGEGEKVWRDSVYATTMKGLYEKYPGQQEVAAFYALSLLGAVPVGRDYDTYGLGAQIAQGILAENPEHPGALHYLIHAYDDPGHAALAIQAANNYSKVAPDASHALHMPSHIYVAMGMWDEVISSNIASYQASVDRMQRMDLDNNARSYHAFAWLMYGYLQKEQTDAAATILQDMIQFTDELPSVPARSYLQRMLGNYLVETGDWDGPFAAIPVKVEDQNVSIQAGQFFVTGMKLFRQKDAAGLKTLIQQLEDQNQAASLQVSDRGTPMCSAGNSRNRPNRQDLDQARVMEMELRSLYAQLVEQDLVAEKWLKEATDLEGSIDYAYGPPDIIYPSFELYAEWLLEQGRPADALAQYDLALGRGPNRIRALRGKLLAAGQLRDENTVKEIRTLIDRIVQQVTES